MTKTGVGTKKIAAELGLRKGVEPERSLVATPLHRAPDATNAAYTENYRDHDLEMGGNLASVRLFTWWLDR